MTIIHKIHRMTEERQVIIDIYENDDESMDKVQSSSSLKDKLNAFIPNTLKHKSLFAFAVTVLCCLALLSLLVNIHNPTEYYSEYQHQGLNQSQSRTLVTDAAAQPPLQMGHPISPLPQAHHPLPQAQSVPPQQQLYDTAALHGDRKVSELLEQFDKWGMAPLEGENEGGVTTSDIIRAYNAKIHQDINHPDNKSQPQVLQALNKISRFRQSKETNCENH